MSYWSRIKTAVGEDELSLDKKITPPQIKQPNLENPSPQNQEVLQVSPQQSQNSQNTTPTTTQTIPEKETQDKLPASLRLQQTLNPVFQRIQHEFPAICSQFQEEEQTKTNIPAANIYETHVNKNPNFPSQLWYFFEKTKHGGMLWYDWFVNMARSGIVPGMERYRDERSLKYYLAADPAPIGNLIEEAIRQRPENFANAVDQVKWSNVVNNFSLNAPGSKGDNSFQDITDTELTTNNRIDRRVGEDDIIEKPEDVGEYSDRELISFWNQERQNQMVAPDISEGEKTELRELSEVFIKTNPEKAIELQDFIQRQAEYKGTSLFAAIDPQKRSKVFADSMKCPMFGTSNSLTRDNSPIALTNWQEYLVLHKGKTVQEVVDAAQKASMATNVEDIRQRNGLMAPIQELLGEISDDFENSDSPFFEFAKNKALDYLTGVYQMGLTENMLAGKDFHPTPDDIASFRRMAWVAYAASMREYRYKEANQFPGVGTSVRRAAYIKTKINYIIDKLESVYKKQEIEENGQKTIKYVPNGEFVPFGTEEFSGGEKKSFLHIGNDGKFLIRTVIFRPGVVLNKDDLIAYLNNPQNAPDKPVPPGTKKKRNSEKEKEPLDTPLTMFNFGKIGDMVSGKEYGKKMMEIVQKYPIGLKKEKQETINDHGETVTKYINQLQETTSKANDEWLSENPHAEDRLAMWRKGIADNLKKYVDGVGIDTLIDKINSSDNNIGTRISDARTNKNWLRSILKGEAIDYSLNDFKKLAETLGVKVDDIFVPYATEYDKYSLNDLTAVNTQSATAMASYGRNFIHRNRVQIHRGLDTNVWGGRAIIAFMKMGKIHSHFTNAQNSKGKPQSEAANVGYPLLRDTGFKWPLDDVKNPQEALQKNDQMRQIELEKGQGDIYRGQTTYRPSSPFAPDLNSPERNLKFPPANTTQFIPNGVDENGNPTFQTRQVEVNFPAYLNQIVKSYRNLHPEINKLFPREEGTKSSGAEIKYILSQMGEEKENSIREISKAWQDVLNSSDSDNIVHEAKNLLNDTDSKIQYYSVEHDKKDPRYQQDLDNLSIQRWEELKNKSGIIDNIEFAKKFIENYIARTNNRLLNATRYNNIFRDTLQQLNLDNLSPEQIQNIKHIIPIKYQRFMNHDLPQNDPNRKFTPIDYVHNKYIEPREPTAKAFTLITKTAKAIDKLISIKNHLITAKIPNELIDGIIDNTYNDFDNRIKLLYGRKNTKRPGRTAKTRNQQTDDKKHYRMWSLL